MGMLQPAGCLILIRSLCGATPLSLGCLERALRGDKMGGPVVRHGRRNQSAEHARHRPMIKAATVLRWQGLNLRARDLENNANSSSPSTDPH